MCDNKLDPGSCHQGSSFDRFEFPNLLVEPGQWITSRACISLRPSHLLVEPGQWIARGAYHGLRPVSHRLGFRNWPVALRPPPPAEACAGRFLFVQLHGFAIVLQQSLTIKYRIPISLQNALHDRLRPIQTGGRFHITLANYPPPRGE